MTLASDLIKASYREGNLIPLDTALTPAQEVEALGILNNFIDSLLGFELGEFAFDWPVPPSSTSGIDARFPLFPQGRELPSDVFLNPPPNVRIILNLAADTTLFLQQDPDDGARMLFVNIDATSVFKLTVDGNGRLTKGTKTVTELSTALDKQLWLYRADLANWTLVSTLELADESPLPSLYDDLLTTGTMIRLAPRFGRPIPSETAATFKRLLKRMKTQYRQSVPVPTSSTALFNSPAFEGRGVDISGGDLF